MKLFDIYGTLKIKGLKEAKSGLSDVAREAEQSASLFNRVWKRASATASGVWSKIRSSAKSSFSGISSDASSLSSRLSSAFRRIKLPKVSLSTFKSSLKTAESVARSTSNHIKNVLGSVRNAFSSLKGVLSGVPGMLAGVGLALGTKSVLDYSKSLDQARINWKVLMGSAEEGQKMLERIQKFAKDTPFDFNSTQKFAQQLKIAGLNGDQLFKTMQVIGDAAQGNVEKAEGIATAYQQMSAKGRIQTEEMNQLLERGIPAWDMLAKATGKTKAELMDMASKGKLMADEYLPKLVEQMDKAFGGGMQDQAKTFSGQIDQLEDNLLMLGSRGIEPLREGIKNLVSDINDVFDGNMTFFELVENWGSYIRSGLMNLGEMIANFDLKSFLSKMFENIADYTVGFAYDVIDGFKSLVEGIVKFFENTDWNGIVSTFQDGLVSAFKSIDIGGILAWVVNMATRLAKALIKAFRGFDYGKAASTIGKLIREAISKVGDFLSNVSWGDVISTLWSGFTTALKLLFIDLPNFLANLIVTLLTGMSISEIGTAISDLFDKMGNWISEKWDALLTWFSEQGNSIGETISGWWDSMSETLSGWWQNISEWFSEKRDDLVKFFTEFPEKAGEQISTWWDNLVGFFDGDFGYKIGEWFGEKIGELIKFFIEFPSKVAETVSTWWDAMTEAFSTWWKNVATWISEKWQELIQWFKDLPSKIADWGIWIWNGVTGSLATFWQNTTTWVSEKFAELVGWFRDLPNKISQWGQWIWSGIVGSLTSLWGTVTRWFTEKFNQLVGWFREAPTKVSEFGSWIWNSISSGLNSLWENVKSIGESIVQGVWNGITSAADWFYGQIKGFFSGLIDGAKSALGINSPSKEFAKIGHWIPPGIAVGVDENSDVAVDSITSLAEDMQDAWNGDFETNLSGYGQMSFDAETSAPFKTLSDKFNELITAFNDIEFKGSMIVDGEKMGEAVFKPLNNLIEEGGLI